MTHEQWIKLSPEEKCMKVAELCGWHHSDGYWWKHTSVKPQVDGVRGMEAVPNYLTDLNAMHEAEDTIHNEDFSNPEWLKFLMNMGKVINQRRAHASAAQRAEAFVLTMSNQAVI